MFDTAFHQTMPASAHAYAIPYDMYAKQGVRKYGMHGTSYRFLVSEASKYLQISEDQLNLVIGHIGEHTEAISTHPSTCYNCKNTENIHHVPCRLCPVPFLVPLLSVFALLFLSMQNTLCTACQHSCC